MSAPTNHVERIAKLIKQSEESDNENEASAYMEAAQRLSTTFNIDLAKARQVQLDRIKAKPTFKRFVIGEKGTKGLRILTDLLLGIARTNDLRSVIYGNGMAVQVYGFQEDIDATEALYASLSVQMASAAAEFINSGEYAKETVWSPERYEYRFTETGKKATKRDYENSSYYSPDVEGVYVPGKYKPVSKLTARLEFQHSFAERVENRLYLASMDAKDAAQREDNLALITEDGVLTEEFMVWHLEESGIDLSLEEEKITRTMVLEQKAYNATMIVNRYRNYLATQHETTAPGTALVLADKKKEVDEFFVSKVGYLRGSYGGHSSSGKSSSASSAGYAAGSSAKLSGNGSSLPGARKQIS